MRRADIVAIAQGALVGAALAVVAVLIWTAAARPTGFPTTAVAALPTQFVIPVPTPRPELPLTLTPEGLGLVSFGEDGEATVQKLEKLLGTPNSDDHWTCPDPAGEVRFVGWADLGLFVIDGVFVGWVDAIYFPPEFGPLLGLETKEGLGIGLDLEDMQAQYGDRQELLEPDGEFEADLRKFAIDGEGGLWGIVENGPDGSRVITLAAGTTCFDSAP